MANPFTVTPDTLTLGELTAIEELTDWTIPEIMQAFVNGEGAQYASFMLALQLIAGTREEDGNYSVQDAGSVRYMDLIPSEPDDVAAVGVEPPDAEDETDDHGDGTDEDEVSDA